MRSSDIIAALPALSDQERAAIVAACSLLTSMGEELHSCPADLLWRGYKIFGEKKGIMLVPLGAARKSRGWPAFKKHCAVLDVWLIQQLGCLREEEWAHVYRVTARCIMHMVDHMGIVLTRTTLMQQAQNATQAIDLQFPGYASSGMLRRAMF